MCAECPNCHREWGGKGRKNGLHEQARDADEEKDDEGEEMEEGKQCNNSVTTL
jgi:hypothetical protein